MLVLSIQPIGARVYGLVWRCGSLSLAGSGAASKRRPPHHTTIVDITVIKQSDPNSDCNHVDAIACR